MERVIPENMRKALESNRQELNLVYERYRCMHREPDAEDITGIFSRLITPVFGHGLDIPGDLLCDIFGTVLNLTGRGCIGREGRYAEIEKSFFALLECYAVLLSSEKGFVVAVFNALFNLYSKSDSAMTMWSDRMMSLKSGMDIEKFRRCGFIAAWRCGTARYRDEALNLLGTLSYDDFKVIFDTGDLPHGEIKNSVLKLKDDPWRSITAASPEKIPKFLYAGGFRGYGGEFISVPNVFASGDSLFAADAGNVFRIYADIFGVELIHEPDLIPAEIPPAKPGNVYGKSREVILGGKAYPLPDFCSGEIKNSASSGNTVVWTLQDSYKIYIAGLGSSDA